jgi:serine/threonine protein kinase
LAEIESARVGGRDGGREGGREGRAEEGSLKKRTHCVVKVPSCDKSSETSRIFEMESTLLRKVSGHRSIVATPTVQILNFANEFLQLFFSHLPEHKQPPLTELFFSGTCSEAYIYPLYGVTMATKIKSGLSPEKAVRYAYQLADTMYFLQQRGVIHQTLLPENIQVMSNDRVMVCNFETAVQTDPSTCTLLISHSFVAPSNRMGLAPEVLNGFNRVDPEMIDYSTQYPWSFGALSVVMATGISV